MEVMTLFETGKGLIGSNISNPTALMAGYFLEPSPEGLQTPPTPNYATGTTCLITENHWGVC